MSAFIAVEHVVVNVEDATVLEQTSFTRDRGQALAITGANGTVKTTLPRVLAGLARALRGGSCERGLCGATAAIAESAVVIVSGCHRG